MKLEQLLKVLNGNVEISIKPPEESGLGGCEYIGLARDLPYWKYKELKDYFVFDSVFVENERLIILLK